MIDNGGLVIEAIRFLGLHFIGPIAVEVHTLAYDENVNKPGDGIYVFTPHPWRYFAKISLTNRTAKTAYVKSANLTISDTVYQESGDTTNLRLDARERKDLTVIFPTDKNGDPEREGNFALTIVPTVGRKRSARGSFPRSSKV